MIFFVSLQGAISTVRSRISEVYRAISFKLGTSMEPIKGQMHVILFFISDPRWPTGGHLCLSTRPDFVCPEPDLGSLQSNIFQTWYKHGTYKGANARHLVFELRSKMADRRPSLFLKRVRFCLSGAGSQKFTEQFLSILLRG